MSDADDHSKDVEFDIVDVDVRAWVEASRADPARYPRPAGDRNCPDCNWACP